MRSIAGDVIRQAFSQCEEGKLHKRLYIAITKLILSGISILLPACRRRAI